MLSSQLTVTSINMNINGLTDLAAKPVGIFEADVVPFKKLNLQFMRPLPWNSAEDEAKMLSLLRSGELTALILDKPFVQYQAASTCDLHVVGDTVLPVNLGFAFPPSTDLVNMTWLVFVKCNNEPAVSGCGWYCRWYLLRDVYGAAPCGS